MSALPVFGSAPIPMMQRMGQSASEPYTFVSELKKDFTVREIPMTATKIDDDIGVLLVVHPRDITERRNMPSTNLSCAAANCWLSWTRTLTSIKSTIKWRRCWGKVPANLPCPNCSKPGAWTWT
jgi:hypothetical protein